MTTSRLRATVVACTLATAATATAATATNVHAQTVTSRVPGDPANTGTYGSLQLKADSNYDNRGSVWRFLFGENWRSVWAAPITVPYLDLNTFAGGLTPYKAGGNQTRTLHFHGKDGRHYVFRSVGKSVQSSLGPDLEHTPVGGIIQDQNSANHPSSATIANIVQNVTGVLHPAPTLVVLPDIEALGEFRKVYGNMLGHVEIDPDDVPDGVEQFAHADEIDDADKLLENLEKSTDYRLDARAYLKDRLVDAIMGDFDRGADQWAFARYDKDGVKTYVPIARDRDWAFMRANGAAMREIRHIYAKIGSYDPENEKLRSITFMTHEFDRSHLVALPWSTWQEVATEIANNLTDDAIEYALNAQPSSYNAVSAQRIRDGLRARRSGLQQLAREYFEMVNIDADVFAADGNERADIDRNADGSLHVRIAKLDRNGAPESVPYFERTFMPKESEEVRVYMEDGDDQVVVRGQYPSTIKLRVVGGAGDDMLVDSTGAQRGETIEFYDASGNNRIMSGPRTAVHTRPYVTAQPTTLDPTPKEKPKPRKVQEERRGHFQDQWRIEGADFTTQRTQTVSTRFWGGLTALAPVIDLRDGAGVVLGAGLLHTGYGFRSLPYASRVGGHVMYATSAARPGADVVGQFFPANHPFSLGFRVLASGFESQRFYGYGNETALIDESGALIMHNELRVESSIGWGFKKPTTFSIGPVLRVIDEPHFMPGAPADVARPFGTSAFSAAGLQAAFTHDHVDNSAAPHRGFRVGVTADALDAIHNGDGVFGNGRATLSGYVPLGAKPTLALRVGGERAFGSFPIQDAALLGGRFDLRGYRWDRYSGDTSLFGNAEVRAPLTRITLLVRGDLGAIALADIGRVWMDGASDGDWHHSFGGGLSFSSLSKAVSVVWAHGEENRVYLNLGLPF